MFKVFGFYKFIKIKSLKKKKILLQKFLTTNNIRGTIIISQEGLNGTISGNNKNIEKIVKKIKFLFLFKNFDCNNISGPLQYPYISRACFCHDHSPAMPNNHSARTNMCTF